jgi:hypothetical protein
LLRRIDWRWAQQAILSELSNHIFRNFPKLKLAQIVGGGISRAMLWGIVHHRPPLTDVRLKEGTGGGIIPH